MLNLSTQKEHENRMLGKAEGFAGVLGDYTPKKQDLKVVLYIHIQISLSLQRKSLKVVGYTNC